MDRPGGTVPVILCVVGAGPAIQRWFVMQPEKFTIRLLPGNKQKVDSNRIGEIRVGSFVERFAVYPFDGSVEEVAARWKGELRLLIDGASAVGLPTASNMSWVLYRVGNEVFVRQMLMLPGVGPKLVRGGRVVDIPERTTVNVDGDHVSEWATTIEAVSAFVAA
jgi:hypothetical protein